MKAGTFLCFVFLAGTLMFSISTPSVVAQQQELLKVGFVDLVRVRNEYGAYQDALAKIKEDKEKEQSDLDEMVANFDKQVKSYELKEGLIPEEEQKQELEDLKKKYEALTETHQTMSQQLEAKSRKILKPLLDQMKSAIEQVSQTQSYHLIFWKKDLAFSDNRLDITDDVLAVLNKK